MKTVQQVMRMLDAQAITDCYLIRDPIRYDREEQMDLTAGQIRDRMEGRVKRLIEKLRTLPLLPLPDGHQGILYAHRVLRGGRPDLAFDLVLANELLQEGDEVTDCAYEMLDHGQIAGFLVAETPLTQGNLERLMADVLYEASFFGFEQEALKDQEHMLEEAVQDVRENGAEPWDPVRIGVHVPALEGSFSPVPEDKEEQELRSLLLRAAAQYGSRSRKEQLSLLRKLLIQSGFGESGQ